VTAVVLVEQHSEMDAGLLITFVTELVQPLALFRGAVLSLNGQAAEQSSAANDYRRDKR
jgi:hypothetical protein